ncbi:MAG TPA: serine/threonine-protein kinase, partial [Gemmatimonadaceae bacterium]
MALATGACLGPYKIVAPLGSGGMGRVWRARDTRLDREVAIKVLPPEFASDVERRIRFEREAKAIAHLNDPHICAVYDVGWDSGVPYFVMELVEGETLAARIARGALPVDELIQMGIEIAEALENAHLVGIVHRDLKPANVMITKSGVKLLDFGLAKILARAEDEPSDDSTAVKSFAGTVVGTTPYMSPEQAVGENVDPRSDIFSLGSLLYEMATGQRAFHGQTTLETLEQLLFNEPKPIGEWNHQIPDEFQRLIRKCMQKDPRARYQSAREIVVDLENLRKDVRTRPLTRSRKAARGVTISI